MTVEEAQLVEVFGGRSRLLVVGERTVVFGHRRDAQLAVLLVVVAGQQSHESNPRVRDDPQPKMESEKG